MARARIGFGFVLVWVSITLLAGVSDAWALTQPNGTLIPTGPTQLPQLFASRGEGINAINDAAIMPEKFVPSCALTFAVLQRNADNKNSFGWYNVKPTAPTNADLHEVLACTDGVGTSRTVDIKNDPAYTGGEIGFYQATGNCGTISNHTFLFFSQRAFNPDGSGSNVFIHLLIYNSTVVPRAFYFGWEDLLSGGDNDFDDLTTFVTGITCSGGGGSCSTGLPGVCAEGTQQCQNGALHCVQSTASSDEVCNGLDDDCDGMVDDGATCTGTDVCDRGTCVPPCSSVEFPCSGDDVCNSDGLCVDPLCIDKDCPAGQRCVDGECKEPCGGVICPHGQVCRVGACVDPCATLTCDASQVCVAGVCTDRCECGGCAGNETCQANGACVATACVSANCPAGQFCAADGSCVDACAGTSCPLGQVCETGACVAGPPPPDAGVPDIIDAGPFNTIDAAGGADAAESIDAGNGNPGDGRQPSGCGCRVGARGQAPAGATLMLLLVAGIVVATRRRRR